MPLKHATKMKKLMKFVRQHKVLSAWILLSALLAGYLILPFVPDVGLGSGADLWSCFVVIYPIPFLMCSVFLLVGDRRNEFERFFWYEEYECTYWGKIKSIFVNFVRDHRRISLWWGLRIIIFLYFVLFLSNFRYQYYDYVERWYVSLALSLLPGFFFFVHWLCVGGRAKKNTNQGTGLSAGCFCSVSDKSQLRGKKVKKSTAKKGKEPIPQQLPDFICPRCGNVYNVKSTTMLMLKGGLYALKMAVCLLVLGGVLCVLSFSLFSVVGVRFYDRLTLSS